MVKELSIIEIAKKQISIETNYSISDAIRIMHESKISRLIVKQNKKTVGIISEKDIINYQKNYAFCCPAPWCIKLCSCRRMAE